MLRRDSTLSKQSQDEENQTKSESEVLRLIQILSLESQERTLMQLNYVARKLERSFTYFKKLKSQLREDILLKLIKSLLIERFKQCEVVFNQGETGRKMYFILEGEVSILVKNQDHFDTSINQKKSKLKKFEDVMAIRYPNFRQVAVKKQFDYFGEIAIEQRIPRTATVIAKEATTLAVLTYESYQKLLRDITQEAITIRSELITQIYPFNQLNETSLQQLLHDYEEINLNGGALLFKRMQKADCLYLIISGEVLVQKWEDVKNKDEFEEENLIETNMMSKSNKQLVNLGVFGRGQMIGDFEQFLNLKQTIPLVRCTQGVVQNQAKIFRIGQNQFNEIIRHTLGMGWYENYLIEKYQQKRNNSIPKIKLTTRNVRTQSNVTILNGFRDQSYIKISSNKYKIIKNVEEKLPTVSKQSPKRKLQLTIDYKDKTNLKYYNVVTPLQNKPPLNSNQNFTMKFFASSMKQKILDQKNEETIQNFGSSKYLKTEPSSDYNIPTCGTILLSPRYSKFIKKETSFHRFKS
ncbi:unnamed protein product (macronuclear) [Paramecium tetraurelia]|uniref:Cyclic nucleotide-binding domain-containing protein n=1 Tax=Paramecium tetraurelia TaxID=5888 RepID=A0BJA8_PARTE|nr:uncharacterized protein GSPATT00004998001 [Paramecium tetraurelia]CAK58625.1 unnamed protein product [Paramecium tetraurelia]|eukprot:XP_001426023.1 hypothetical protein (macronuclear) [Paramecium tetraurelia strain d4-2]